MPWGKAWGGTLKWHTSMCLSSAFIGISHISCSSAWRQKNPWHTCGWETEEEKQEAAAEESCAKCPPSPNWALTDHLDSSSFCPCWGMDCSLVKQGAHHPAAVKAPGIPLTICFHLGEFSSDLSIRRRSFPNSQQPLSEKTKLSALPWPLIVQFDMALPHWCAAAIPIPSHVLLLIPCVGHCKCGCREG